MALFFQYGQQMMDLLIHIFRRRNGLADLIAKDLAETFSQTMHFHAQGVVGALGGCR